MSEQPDSQVQSAIDRNHQEAKQVGDHGTSTGQAHIASTRMAGFWRRVAAFFVDGLFLSIAGWMAGLFLADQFAALGPWGRLLGFCIAWVYFGLLDSRINAGQSFGKRILGIQVIGRDGGALSVPRAFLRFLPVGVPWFLNNAALPATWATSPITYVMSVAVIGLGSCALYLLAFNRATGQTVQDLLVGSCVVRADEGQAKPMDTRPPRPVHLIVCGVLLLGSAIAPFFVQRAADTSFFAPLMKIYTAVNAPGWVGHATVHRGQTFVASVGQGSRSSTSLSIVAYVADANIDDTERAGQLARLALSADPTAREVDAIAVDLVYGYDIGIASSWRSQSTTHAPAEWLAH